MKSELEKNLDYDAIFQAGGRNLGNEDFYLFCCPNCAHLYLLEYEADTIYIDGNDLTKRFHPTQKERFKYISCGFKFARNMILIGKQAPEKMKVNLEQLNKSDWLWALRKNA